MLLKLPAANTSHHWPLTCPRQACAAAASVMHLILQHGGDLWLGPDSDGLLNLPPTAAQPAHDHGTRRRGDPSATRHADTGSCPLAGTLPGEASFEVQLPEGRMDVQKLLASLQLPQGMPQAPLPAGITTAAKPFQLQGLQWLLQRERKKDALGRGLLALHPEWVQLVARGGEVMYVQRGEGPLGNGFWLSTAFTPAPVPNTCGGLLCDEVGVSSVCCMHLTAACRSPAQHTLVHCISQPE